MARSTVANTIERIRRQLNAAIRHETNQLAVNVNTTTTTITTTFDLQASIRAGSILSIGRELCRVISANDGSKEITVMRGWQDSDAEAHTAGDEILVNPRFTRKDIYEGIIDEITSWSPQLFTVATYEWTVTDQDATVEVPALYADAIGLVSLRRKWDDDDVSTWPTIGFRTMRGGVSGWSGADTSGLLIRLLPNGGIHRAGTIVGQLAIPYDVVSAELLESDDLVADHGLEYSMLELVDLGVKMRVLADAEVGRTQRHAQDEPRAAEEVSHGSALTVAQTIRANYTRRFGDEVRKLQNRYKPRAW